jgi:acyl homoserine lactone synthase
MIKLIYGHERAQFPQLIDSMHRLRKSVFHERLKWDVPVSGDWEIDDFDNEDPLYVLVVDAKGAVQGSLRLLPTTGPNMLRDVFSAITQDSGQVENPFVWESSRFCIRFSDDKDQRESTTISRATVELIAGMGEVGILAGLDHVVTVYDAFLRRIIRQTGCNETLVGQPVRFGRVQTYAGLFDIDAIQLAAFKRVWNLPDTLIDQDSRSRLFAAA